MVGGKFSAMLVMDWHFGIGVASSWAGSLGSGVDGLGSSASAVNLCYGTVGA